MISLEDAKDRAEELVYVNMTRSQIEFECRERGIPIVKNRMKMEFRLIEAITKELMEK